MSDTNPTIRETYNHGVLQRLGDANQDMLLGDLMAMLIAAATPTQAGLVPSAAPANWDLLTLGNAADAIYLLNATAGTFTGILTLVIDARDSRIPKSGEAVWDGKGTTRVRLNNADAITAVSALYSRSDGVNRNTSMIDKRSVGQRD